jgi:hypothetical protein
MRCGSRCRRTPTNSGYNYAITSWRVHINGYQGLGRRLEDSSPYSRQTYNDKGRGGKAGTYKFQGGRAMRDTASGSPNAKETKDGPDQNKAGKRRDI